MRLNDLQGLGCLSSSYQEVKFKSAISLSEYRQLMQSESVSKQPVVVDGCEWAATLHRLPITKADTVYSCNGAEVGCWKRSEASFYLQELQNNKLVTVNQIKEETRMSNLDNMSNLQRDLANIGTSQPSGGVNTSALNGLEDELAALSTNAEAAQNVEAFNESAEDKKDKELTPEQKAKKQEREQKEREKRDLYNSIRQAGSGRTIAERDTNLLNNTMHGRLLFFITKTDPVVKVSLKKTPIVGPNKMKILNAKGQEAPDIRKKFEAGKTVSNTYLECEAEFAFKHAKPPKPVGVVIKTPAKYEMSMTDLTNDKISENGGVSATDFVVKVLSMEQAFAYVAANYKDEIREDDTILKQKATTLRFCHDAKTTKDSTGETQSRLVSSVKLSNKEGVRETLLTDGNFFPISVYQTASLQDPSEDVKKQLNYNFASCIAGYLKKEDKPKLKDGLVGFDGQPGIVSVVEQQGGHLEVTSEYVNGTKTISPVRYDSKKEPLTDVRLPLREESVSKNGKITYKYLKYGLADKENGPLRKPLYKNLISLTGMNEDEFVKRVERINAKAPSSKKKDAVTLTSDEYLSWKMVAGNYADGTTSLYELQRSLMDVVM